MRKSYTPLLLSSAVCLLWTLGYAAVTLRRNGEFVYALDDAYIHLATAKNLALHGVWGITPYEFSSSVSSLLWVIMLAGFFRLFGTTELAPVWLCAASAIAALWSAEWALRKNAIDVPQRTAVLLMLVILAPMPTLIGCGMEHLTQTAVCIAFLALATEALTASRSGTGSETGMTAPEARVLVMAPLVSAIRYEGIFLVFAVCLLCVQRGWWRYAILLGVLCWLPVFIYGAISMSEGSSFLPNSLLLKTDAPSALGFTTIWKFIGRSVRQLTTEHVALYTLMIAAATTLYRFRQLPEEASRKTPVMLTLFLITAVLHAALTTKEHFYRYDAWLICLGILSFAVARSESAKNDRFRIRWTPALIPVIALLFLPVAARAREALAHTPQAMTNIYEQQIQMGKFFRIHYRDERVAANDIGAMCYIGEVRCLDLYGLGSSAVAGHKRAGTWTTEAIAQLTAESQVKVAVVYESWFQEKEALPHSWQRIGRWTIDNNVVCGDRVVSFFAVAPDEAPRLKDCLASFAPSLPNTVTWFEN